MHTETRFGDTRTRRERALDELDNLTRAEESDEAEDIWTDDEVVIYIEEPKNEYEWRQLLDGVAEQAFRVDPGDFADFVYSEMRGNYESGSETQAALNEFLAFPRNEYEWHERVEFLRALWRNPLQSLLDASHTLQAYLGVDRRAHRSKSLKSRNELRREALAERPEAEDSETE